MKQSSGGVIRQSITDKNKGTFTVSRLQITTSLLEADTRPETAGVC